MTNVALIVVFYPNLVKTPEDDDDHCTHRHLLWNAMDTHMRKKDDDKHAICHRPFFI
jgi:hypothetical protein